MRITTSVAIASAMLAVVPAGTSARAVGRAHAARTISGNAEARLHYIRSSGSTLIEEGPVTGSLSGHMRAVLNVGATFSGSFTFYTHNGQIRGHGSAHLHGGRGGVESFGGSDVVGGGSGRYAHAHGNGHMYGTFNRRNYAVIIQTRGTLHY